MAFYGAKKRRLLGGSLMSGAARTGSNSGRYEFALMTLLILFWGSVGLNRTGLGVIFPEIKPEFGLSNFQVGLLVSGTSVTWAFSSWGGGWLSDRYGRRSVLIPAGIIICVMTAAMGIAGGFWSMFIIRDLLGIGDGVGWSVGEATISEESAPQRRGMNQALFTMGYTLIGAGFGAYIITRIADALSWRWVFPIIAAATAVVVLALALMMRDSPRRAVENNAIDWHAAVGMLRNRTVIMLIVMGCAVLTWLAVSIAYNQLFLTEVRHFSKLDAGDIAEYWGFAGAAGQLILPRASDFWGRRGVVLVAAAICALSLALYLMGDFEKRTMQVLIGLSGFCGHGLLPIVLATCVIETVSEEVRGSALGVTNFFAVIVGTTVMPLVGGFLADHITLVAAMWIPVFGQIVIAAFTFSIAETAPRIVARRPPTAGSEAGD